MTPAPALTRAVTTWRRIGHVPLALRLIVATAAAVATLATTSAAWNAPDVYVVVAVVTATSWALAPDSAGGLTFTASIAVTWLTGAPGRLGPAVVVVAIAMLVAHVSAALAAAMPVTAAADARLVLRWARPTAAIALVVLGGTGVAAAIDAWSPRGSLVVMLGALTLATVASWWWSAPPDGDDSP